MWEILHILKGTGFGQSPTQPKEVINIEDVKNIRELIKNYIDGFLGCSLGAELSGKPKQWKKGFARAFERVDSIIEDYIKAMD